jgi:hypothetical protein
MHDVDGDGDAMAMGAGEQVVSRLALDRGRAPRGRVERRPARGRGGGMWVLLPPAVRGCGVP